MSKMTSKERLEQYIKEDTIYQDYLNKHSNYVKILIDFDRFCMEHCQDIKNILEENEELKKQLEERYNEIKVLRDSLQSATSGIVNLETRQKEFVKYLEDRIKENSKNRINDNNSYQMGVIDTYENIIEKYKETIGEKNE